MTNEAGRVERLPTEDAFLAQAGEPASLSETREQTPEEEATPSAEELDARERNFTRPRKPMGPTEVPESIPDEPGEG